MRSPLRARVLAFAWLACGGSLTFGCGSPPQEEQEPVDVGSSAYSVDPALFSLPPSGASSRGAIMARYAELDPHGVVPRGLLEDAVEYFDVNKAHIPVQTFITVVDFSKFSGELRFFLVDMSTGAVEPHMVAHGSGSDPAWTGTASLFGNTPGSNMTSLGFYLTGEIYDGTHVHSMRLDGLSPDGSPNQMANTNARARYVVMHEASYVDDSHTGKQGRSNGCLALDPSIEQGVVDRIHDGSLIYAAIEPLHPPVGPGAPAPDAGPPARDAGATDADAGTVTEEDASTTPSPDAGGDWGFSGGGDATSNGCAVARRRASDSPFGPGIGAALLALGAFVARRRRDHGRRELLEIPKVVGRSAPR